MKTYFDFTLTGKKFFPVWIFFYLACIIPYVLFYSILLTQSKTGENNPLLSLAFIVIIIAGSLISFYIIKMTIEGIKYRDSNLGFSGKFWTYSGKILLGLFLTIITLTIYMSWFIKNITAYIVGKTSLNSENFSFPGKGSRLFLIFLLSIFIPVFVLAILFSKFILSMNENFFNTLIYQGIIMIVIIPFMYLTYKWLANVKFKDYNITWKTRFFESVFKILIEIILVLVTVGIYMPLAYLRLYKYFIERTEAVSERQVLVFGYEIDHLEDFLFLWGQILLTLITAGIYYPWAYCRILGRISNKTYITTKNAFD